MASNRAEALVIFGITGDLAKKLVLPALYRLEQRHALDEPIVGVARSDWGTEDLVRYAHDSVHAAFGHVDERVFKRLARRFSYVQGEYSDKATFDALKETLADRAKSAVFYLAVPPSVFTLVARSLAREGLADRSRLVVEKPFGTNLASAHRLDRALRSSFHEDQIFRVDHFLGKEAVEDLLVFRFTNALFEPVWNRSAVRSVQLTFSETLDVADRGGFYDPVGAIRDVVQNHLFQVLANVAMDAPTGDGASALQAERARLLRSVRTLRSDDVVRGQYAGYRKVEGVKRGSRTETYVAMRLAIDNARWEGVPFFIRTGKCLPTTRLEIVVELAPAPKVTMLEHAGATFASNLIRLRLQPGAGIVCEIQAKTPGPGYESRSVPLFVDIEAGLHNLPLPYEQVILDALDGSDEHFASLAAIEESWRILDPVLDKGDVPHQYRPGTWGPRAAEHLPGLGGWLPLSDEAFGKRSSSAS